MHRSHAGLVVLCLALLACSLAVPTAGTPRSPFTGQEQPEADNTVTRIQLFENGSARWTVRIRTRLATGEDVEEYEAFQSRFRNNTSRFLDPFSRRIGNVVAAGNEATGREMRATDFTASTSIQEVPRRWGIVTYEFTWTNFAASDGTALAAGDVFQGGIYLAANDTLALAAPPGHEVPAVSPEPDDRENGTVSWEGERSFTDEHPQVRFGPATDGTTDLPTAPVLGLVVAMLAAVLGVAGVVWYRRREDGSGEPATIRTDADRVRETLAEHGGRMHQSDLVEELDWSASKTSRVLSDMDDEGTVEKLRIGRENIVRLPPEED
jgi:hypothetical protein